MSPNPLLPPDGAEPGSVWLLSGSGVWFTAGTWDGAFWLYRDGAGEHVVRSPEYMALTNFTLSDPHGAAAAVSVLEGWRAKYEKHGSHWEWRRDIVDGFQVFINAYTAPFAAASTHPTSFLAAALAAVREWEGRDG